MEVINDVLASAMIGKDKNDWTPVSVNVAPATLTILSEQVIESFLSRVMLHNRLTKQL